MANELDSIKLLKKKKNRSWPGEIVQTTGKELALQTCHDFNPRAESQHDGGHL